MAEEIEIYQVGDVRITNLRAIFGAKTYPVSNITSVGAEQVNASGCLPFSVIAIGVFILIAGFLSLKDNIIPNLVIGLLFIGAGVALARSQKTNFSVTVTTAGGEVKAYTSENKQQILDIVEALNKAIIQKG